MPQFLGDERHQRMNQPQRVFVNNVSVTPVRVPLFQFQVPVAKLIPEKSPDRIRGLVIAMVFKRLIGLLGAIDQSIRDPSIRER